MIYGASWRFPTKASELNVIAAENDLNAARLSLAAQVSKQWFTLIEARQQVALSELIVQSLEQTVSTIEIRYQSGLDSALDVRLARGNLANAASTLSQHQRQAQLTARSFKLLLGDYPDTSVNTPKALPSLLQTIPVGLPSALVSRRPDIIAAENRLHSAQLSTKSASRNRLPSFKLTGAAGLSSGLLRDLLNWDQLIWSLVTGLTAPLFDGGNLSAERLLAEIDEKAALTAYAQAIYIAFLEVENTLSADHHYARQVAALQQAVDESELAAELAASRYRSGLENITTLLDAHRRNFTSQRNLLQIQLSQLNNRIQLYLALGGAFDATLEGTKK